MPTLTTEEFEIFERLVLKALRGSLEREEVMLQIAEKRAAELGKLRDTTATLERKVESLEAKINQRARGEEHKRSPGAAAAVPSSQPTPTVSTRVATTAGAGAPQRLLGAQVKRWRTIVSTAGPEAKRPR